jgi:RNA polymerase sigma factor (sigma-70 family)
MVHDCSFDELMQLLRSRDQSAASDLFHRYAQRLIGLARTRLDARLRGQVDPEDVVQSVFRSFFNRVGDGRWELHSEDSLWAMLVVLTVRKCGRTAKRLLAKKRGGGAPQSELRESDTDSVLNWDPAADDPSPEAAAMLVETMEKLAAELTPRERQIMELRLQDYSVQEISEKIGRTTRMVYRGLERIREKLEEMRRGDLDDR